MYPELKGKVALITGASYLPPNVYFKMVKFFGGRSFGFAVSCSI